MRYELKNLVWGYSQYLTPICQDGDVVSTYADVSELIDDFGYKPDTDLKDGIGEFVKWYRKFYGNCK